MIPPGRHQMRKSVTIVDPPIPKRAPRGRLGRSVKPLPDRPYNPDQYPCSAPTYRTNSGWYNPRLLEQGEYDSGWEEEPILEGTGWYPVSLGEKKIKIKMRREVYDRP